MNHYHHKMHGTEPDLTLIRWGLHTYGPYGCRVAVLGAWHGRSIAAYGVEILNSKHTDKVQLDIYEDFIPTDNMRMTFPEEAMNMKQQYVDNTLPLVATGLNFHTVPVRPNHGADSIADNTYDFIIVDFLHDDANSYLEMLKNWWPKLKPGGIICGSRYFQDGQVRVALNAFMHSLRQRFYRRDKEAGTWMVRKRPA